MKDNLTRLIPTMESEIKNARLRKKHRKTLGKLKANERLFRFLAENASDIIYSYRFNPREGYEYISPSVERKLGYKPEEFYQDPTMEARIVHEGDKRVIENIKRGNFDYSRPVEFRCISKSGEIIWFEESTTPFFDRRGSLLVVEGILRDITKKKITEEQLTYMSFHDDLTDLYNRAYFEEELKRMDTKRQLPLSYITGDIDGLKLVNDAFGHKEGDRLLKNCARILKKCCRAEDIVARYGGDEFSMLFPRTSREYALDVVSRIKESCLKYKGSKIPLSLSLGLATKNSSIQDLQKIIKQAEDDMYRNKLLEAKSITSTIVSSLKKSLFEKSIKTEGHMEKVRERALLLGKSMDLSSSQLDELALLATIYDIGKVAVLDSILNKKQALSEKEWKIIKRHPEVGYRIAIASKQLSSIAEYILTVHERWDGSGYPQGLKGKKIPILSRIIAITDAYQAMRDGRPYKKPLSKNEAIEELERCSGTQFDPELVKKLITILNSKKT
jgi:diguanylate cyclase (GGDEF)-like protein/PAS domain S-box-containing protein